MSHDVHVVPPGFAVTGLVKQAVPPENKKTTCMKARNANCKFGGQDVDDYVFGSISPRGGSGCGAPLGQQQLPLGGSTSEAESPDVTQRDTTESDNNISSCSTLDIMNKVEQQHSAAAHQPNDSQVRELTQRLQHVEAQRQALQRQLDESNAEREMSQRRLEVLSSSHECRITEMHCVIAELTKKLRVKQEHTILEEQEPAEGSEISYQEGSVYNSELNLTNLDAGSQTEPLDGNGSDAYSLGEQFQITTANLCMDDDDDDDDDIDALKSRYEAVNRAQVEALQEEVLRLRAQISLLQSEIASNAQTVKALDETNTHEAQATAIVQGDIDAACDAVASPLRRLPAVPKLAERVKLRCASKPASVLEPTKSEQIAEHEAISESTTPSSLENEDLKRQIEHLNVQNTLLSLSLDESKEHSEHLYLLCGKYESNVLALQLALNSSDRAIEAYDVMLALLESRLALISDKSAETEANRQAAEEVARHLLGRFECEKNVCENSLGPWKNSYSIPEQHSGAPWTASDDNRLRFHVSKFKGKRSALHNTIIKLETPFCEHNEHAQGERTEKFHRSDMEYAILTQELLELRDQNQQLKTKVDETERERQATNERIGVLHDALKQMQNQMQMANESNTLFRQQCQKNRLSYTDAEHAALVEQQLVEALTRETELRARIQSLIATVSATKHLSDKKYEHLHANVLDLQKLNKNLGQLIELERREYETRVRKLEQKIGELKLTLESQTNAAHVKNSTTFVPETTL